MERREIEEQEEEEEEAKGRENCITLCTVLVHFTIDINKLRTAISSSF